jgi:hypothetical protein
VVPKSKLYPFLEERERERYRGREIKREINVLFYYYLRIMETGKEIK